MLITVADAINALGLTNVFEADISGPLTEAISKAQIRLENQLGTILDRYANVDIFYVDTDIYCDIVPAGQYILKLTQAFVDKTASITVSSSDTRAGTYTALDASTWSAFYDLGLIKVDQTIDTPTNLRLFEQTQTQGNNQRFFKVEYTAGYDTQSHRLIEPLKQGLLAYLPQAFQIAAPTIPANANQLYTLSGSLAAAMVERYVRRVSFCYLPVDNTATSP